MTTEEARDIVRGNVAKGVRFLNRKYPNWYKTVKVRMFDFGDPCKCVIGQVCPPSRKIGADEGGFSYDHKKEVGIRVQWHEYGFDSGSVADFDDFDEVRELGIEWTRRITVAREQARK